MPASGFTNAPAATPCSSPWLATAACTVPTVRCPAHPSKSRAKGPAAAARAVSNSVYMIAAMGQVGAGFVHEHEARPIFRLHDRPKRAAQSYDLLGVAFGGVNALFCGPSPCFPRPAARPCDSGPARRPPPKPPAPRPASRRAAGPGRRATAPGPPGPAAARVRRTRARPRPNPSCAGEARACLQRRRKHGTGRPPGKSGPPVRRKRPPRAPANRSNTLSPRKIHQLLYTDLENALGAGGWIKFRGMCGVRNRETKGQKHS